MSLSSEYFTFHLTPAGWVEGTERRDFGGIERRPVPGDRVMTVVFHEYLSSIYSEPGCSGYVEWQHLDDRLVDRLRDKFGSCPLGRENTPIAAFDRKWQEQINELRARLARAS